MALDETFYDELCARLDEAAREFYGEQIPLDFVWDVLPLLYVRLASPTGWARVKAAAGAVSVADAAPAAGASSASDAADAADEGLIPVIDRYLAILSKSYGDPSLLLSFQYGPGSFDEDYIRALVGIVDGVGRSKPAFLELYKRYVAPVGDGAPTPRFALKSYDFACALVCVTEGVRYARVALCANFCWPELLEAVYGRLHCRQLLGMDLEPQSAYFANLYAHVRGLNCTFEAGSFVDAVERGGEGLPAGLRKGLADYALCAVPSGGTAAWAELPCEWTRLGGVAVLLLDFDPARRGDGGWPELMASGRVSASIKLPDGWVLVVRHERRAHEGGADAAGASGGAGARSGDFLSLDTTAHEEGFEAGARAAVEAYAAWQRGE